MRHVESAGGIRHMEIDHFNPTLRGASRNRYGNLMLATRHCNNMKGDAWPTAADKAKGVRFLDPTRETEYGVVIFEDPITHRLVGTTPAARYHIDMLDLNHETFVWERSKRAIYADLRYQAPAMLSGSFEELRDALSFVEESVERMIPRIPPPPE